MLTLRSGSRSLAVLLIVFFAFSGVASADPYFSISTDRTYHPGENITLHIYSRDVHGLEFRLYRVLDPIAFFEKLDDVHSFGIHSGEQEQIDQPTLLERFADWKHDIWVEIRDFIREQFSARARAEIREAHIQARKVQEGTATYFAQVPLLNSKQLVARWRIEVPSHFFSEHQDVPVDSLQKGVYVVEMTDGNLRAYTVLIVSDLALVTKSAPGQLLAFAVDSHAGNPISGTQVALWAARKAQISSKTDSDGVAMMQVAGQALEEPRILAIHDQDVALVAPFFLNISSNPAQDWTGYVYTDRPVYRPGHMVHFKGILRAHNAERYTIPAGRPVQINIQDPNGKQVFHSSEVVSAFGGIEGDYNLPADAPLGYYSISIDNGAGVRGEMTGGFNVEEYKKPEYDVRVTPAKARILEGESVTATIEAKYYFGEPVAGAQVKYVVHRSTYWSPFLSSAMSDFQDESGGAPVAEDEEGGSSDEGGDYAGEQLSEQSGTLDASGQLQISIPTKISDRKEDYRYRIEARVTDESRREISGYSSVIAAYGSFQVAIQADKYMYRPGETMNLVASARDYDGNPVQTPFHVELIHPSWTRATRNDEVLGSADGQTNGDGNASVTLAAREMGTVVKISARTPEGRDVEGETSVWVFTGGNSWSGQQGQVQLIADRKTYQPGDIAHVAVVASVPNTQMLVTTEGRTIQSHRVIQVSGTDVMIDIPITRDNEPNVYVSVAFVHDDTVYIGTKTLKVPADEQKLNVTIQPSRPQFRPGDSATYTLTALDGAGKPVVGEFSLGVVDEAIYAIRPDGMQDIHQFFYGRLENRVGTEDSFTFSFTGEAGIKPMILARRAGPRQRLAQLKPEALIQPKIRKIFPDTAYWAADVRTDQGGHAELRFPFPDSLTTWRATVRGATQDSRFGGSVNKVIVRKNLVVRLAVPRFFRQGDDVTLSTIVHNYLADQKTARMSLDVKGLDLQDAGPQQVTVSSRGDQRVDWQVHAQNVREADLVAKALTNEESDAMELPLPVIPYGVKLADAKSGAVTASSGQQQATVTLPGDPATAAPSLSLSVSPSIAGSIFGALDYLTSYPYGCTEQTMSSFLPDIVVARAMQDLKLQNTINTPELQKKIAAGLERLYDFQHDDGGWGWWKEDESLVFMTSYVVSGLAQTKSAGYAIKAEALSKGENYLKQQLAAHKHMRSDLRAYVVYALALDGNTDKAMLDEAYSARVDMSSQGLSMLGLALHQAGDSRATEIADRVEKQAMVDESEAHWSSQYDYLMEFWIDDSAESTAYALRLLSLTRPESPLLQKAAFWLVNHRDGGFFWASTKQTSMVVFGLLEYMKISHELDADFNAIVYVNDKQVFTRHFTRADALTGDLPRLNLTTEQLRSGANNIRVEKSGRGRLYWSARGEYYSTDKRFFQSNRFSLNIQRDYYRLVPQQQEGKIVYDLQPLHGEVHSGDVLAVRLSVNGSEWRYLLVEDPIPAGAEFIQRDDLYELNTHLDWWGSWFTRREFHDDRAAFFQTYFDKHQEYVYLLKIVNPGTFRISPASVQPMYQPSVMATTDALILEVKP